jgi:hypothetical protein
MDSRFRGNDGSPVEDIRPDVAELAVHPIALPNIPVAIIEAKDNNHSVGDGMQQGLDYAATLDIPFVFSSNGDGFVFHDRTCADGAPWIPAFTRRAQDC